MVYTHALRACGASHAGSSPASGTKLYVAELAGFTRPSPASGTKLYVAELAGFTRPSPVS